jgi:hypothetical protein
MSLDYQNDADTRTSWNVGTVPGSRMVKDAAVNVVPTSIDTSRVFSAPVHSSLCTATIVKYVCVRPYGDLLRGRG